MQSAPRSWEPANDVERTLRYAWEREDRALFLRTLAGAPLYLPGFEGRAGGTGAAGQRLLTRCRGQRTYLVVFTSPEALYEGVGEVIDGWRLTSLAELTRAWPDRDWGLLVSPTTPIGAYLGPDELAAMAELVADEPVFHPADAAEALMFRALRGGDPGTYLDVLVTSRVLLPLAAPAAPDDLGHPDFPWRVATVDELPTVSAFTSPQRMAEAVTEPLPTVRVEMMALAHVWPDRSWRLAINPGSAIPAMFTGTQVPDLIRWARGLVTRQLGVPGGKRPVPVATPAGPRPVDLPALEVVIAPDEVNRYLHAGYDRVSGAVYRAGGASVPSAGYLIRWYHEADAGPVPADGDMVRELPVPSGARLYQLRDGTEKLLGTYQVELHRWVPVVADLLRGLPE